ncbi:hypothetical protein AXF42_Ash012385 [Apostasia shenzhenica]|uniref:Uncharacterized protein n=1 Tax=Apostasia shenzhenica TaxID=1088818 RepID=A0A2I0AD36_9ASPA|nr:hypothetical protein AXF42_Ash012385 [Apostasia shenzhenica]
MLLGANGPDGLNRSDLERHWSRPHSVERDQRFDAYPSPLFTGGDECRQRREANRGSTAPTFPSARPPPHRDRSGPGDSLLLIHSPSCSGKFSMRALLCASHLVLVSGNAVVRAFSDLPL